MKPSHTPMPKKIAVSRQPYRVASALACSMACLSLVKSSTSATSTAAVITRPSCRDGSSSAKTAPAMLPSAAGALTLAASPQGMRIGSDTAEPDEAAVFRKPHASPAPSPSTSTQIS